MGSITIMVTAAELLYTKTGIVTEIKSVHQLCRIPSNTVPGICITFVYCSNRPESAGSCFLHTKLELPLEMVSTLGLVYFCKPLLIKTH